MKISFLCISLVLVCLHLTSLVSMEPSDDDVRVSSIHGRITSSPSAGGAPKITVYQQFPTIERTIETHRRNRRFAKNVPSDDYGQLKAVTSPYPKHHLLQPIQVVDEQFMPVEDLNTSTAPYTDNHHSWKKSSVLFPKL